MNKETPSQKLSVIVPVYKVEEFLAKCVDSILRQSYKNLEVILVDDGSPDKCPAICDEYSQKDSRIKVIHKLNGGLCSARNAGLDMATGEYVTFVDSDDWLEEDAYSCMMEQCIENQCDIIGGVQVYPTLENREKDSRDSVRQFLPAFKLRAGSQ